MGQQHSPEMSSIDGLGNGGLQSFPKLQMSLEKEDLLTPTHCHSVGSSGWLTWKHRKNMVGTGTTAINTHNSIYEPPQE